MLTSYTIKGFKSFMEETTVDLLPTNYKTLANQNIYNGVLKGALFIGANASGKSNIIVAIKLLIELLYAKYDVRLDDYLCLFSAKDTLQLSFEFKISGKNIRYNIDYNRVDTVLVERLNVDEALALERMGSTAISYIGEEKNYTNISNNVLILREIYFNTKFRNNNLLIEWFAYLNNFIYIDLCKRTQISFNDNILHTNTYLEKFGVEEINNFFTKYHFGQSIEYKKVDDKTGITLFKRQCKDVSIPYNEESLGNQTLLILLNKFFYIVEHGGILILDEFSSGFHNDLEELLIKYFMENAKNSQLLFVSHSTNLLSNRLLRPDQIYTVEFENGKGSVVNRVSKEQPREAQNLEKMYLGGVFGGLPNYSNNTEQE